MDIEKLKNSAKKDSLLECFLSKGPVEEISSGSSRDVGLEKGLGAASVDFYEACMRSKKAEHLISLAKVTVKRNGIICVMH